MTIIFLIVLTALVGYNIYLNIQQRRKQEKQELEQELERKRQELLQQAALQEKAKKKDLPMVPANQLIKDLLTNLNCDVTVTGTEKDVEFMEFSYQGGHFTVSASTQNGGFRLGYMFFFSTSVTDLPHVHKLINTLNSQTQFTRFTCSFVKEENKIFVHQLLSCMLVAGMPGLQNFWNILLNSCFEHHRIFIQKYNELDKKNDEREEIDRERMFFLLNEHEIAKQDKPGQMRIDPEKPYPLRQFIETVLENPGAQLNRLKITTDQLTVLNQQHAIEEYSLQQALIEGEGQDAHFVHKDAELTLTLTLPEMSQKNPETVVILLQAERETSNALYFRLSYHIPPHSISKDCSLTSQKHLTKADSLLLAYDKHDWQEKRSEAEFMWQDAHERIQKKEKLLPEQELLVSSTLTNMRYGLYWGKKAFMEKRYYDAIFYLEPLFFELQKVFYHLHKSDGKLFFDICFFLGVCYNALGLYQKANYYLGITFNLNHIPFIKEYINGLVHIDDFRSLPTIDALLDRMDYPEEQADDEDQDDDKHLTYDLHFRYFLLRHKAQILENEQNWEEAEKIYKELLNDPDSETIALTKLAYIQKQIKEAE